MPRPKSDESRKEFMERCMADPESTSVFPDASQRYAVCNSVWTTDRMTSMSKFLDSYAEKTYTDYPKQASENAKIALRYAEENGWGDCGEASGKARANQLANNEPISEETISRMASFERHRQNSKRELGEGCGRLMWLAWGGDEGIEWAQRKLEQIRNEKAN
jgi:hypothetical protein